MVFLVTLHGFIRWLILLAALIGLGDAFYALYGGKREGGALGRPLPRSSWGSWTSSSSWGSCS